MLALVSVQLAAASPGAQCRLYKRALGACATALARVRALHRRLGERLQRGQGLGQGQRALPPGMPLAAMMSAAAAAKKPASLSTDKVKGKWHCLRASTVTIIGPFFNK